jgi:hypothetical protein
VISFQSPRALLDGLTLPLDVASSATQANWHMPSAVARMTMHNAYLYGLASDGL